MYINLRDKEVRYIREDSTFQPLFNDIETKLLLQDTQAFDGKTVRLNGLTEAGKQLTFHISEGSFYELLATNILINQPTDKQLLELKSRLIERTVFLTPETAVSNPYLANAIAISVLVRDREGRYLITERTSSVAISSNYFGVSATAGLDEQDYLADDPIKHCVKRELKEELNIESDYEIELLGFFIDDIKYQPSILVNVQLNQSFDELAIQTGVDFSIENSSYNLVDEAMLAGITFLQMTQAAYTHIQHAIDRYYEDEVGN